MDKRQNITVTSPLLPNLKEFGQKLKEIWDAKWITNNGSFHQELEQELATYLKVPYISLFTNGTLPLITAFQALGITRGEVITTPYSFVATTHAIWWNGLIPVFVDVDPKTGDIDPDKIEEAITPNTVAIMPVHVYGNPCDTKRIQEIASAHGFAVLSETAVFQYKCDNFYAPQADGGISILDESLGIDWRIPTDKALLSDKDTRHPLLKDFETPFTI